MRVYIYLDSHMYSDPSVLVASIPTTPNDGVQHTWCSQSPLKEEKGMDKALRPEPQATLLWDNKNTYLRT